MTDLPGITVVLDLSQIQLSPYPGPYFDLPGAVEAWEHAIADDQKQAARLYQDARDWVQSGDYALATIAQRRAHGVHAGCMQGMAELEEHRRRRG